MSEDQFVSDSESFGDLLYRFAAFCCEHCEHVYFLIVSAVVIVVLIYGDSILLTFQTALSEFPN